MKNLKEWCPCGGIITGVDLGESQVADVIGAFRNHTMVFSCNECDAKAEHQFDSRLLALHGIAGREMRKRHCRDVLKALIKEVKDAQG